MTARPRLLSSAELQARAADLARVAEADEADDLAQRGLLVATLGRERLGIDIRHVREVVRDPQVTPLPMAPSYIAGVVNVRGEIIGVLDLARLLSLPAATTVNAIVVSHDGVSAALLVGSVEDVGVFRAGETTITTLDIPEILARPQRESAEAAKR